MHSLVTRIGLETGERHYFILYPSPDNACLSATLPFAIAIYSRPQALLYIKDQNGDEDLIMVVLTSLCDCDPSYFYVGVDPTNTGLPCKILLLALLTKSISPQQCNGIFHCSR